MLQQIIKISSLGIMLLLLCSCFMPGSNAEDNILLTYDMDTIGPLNRTSIVTVLINDSLPIAADTISKVPDTVKTVSNNLVAWNKEYPSNEIVSFAKTLIGTPYLYGSTNPAEGFDCSGFITYVFNHFNFKVPRSSVEFTNLGKEIPMVQALPGDLVLFAGTDSSVRTVGHMGIVVDNVGGELQFIHSSSGKANGVTISPLKGYYEGRFVKVISLKEGL